MKIVLATFSLMLVGALALNCEQGFVANALSICIQPRYIQGCFQYKTETSCKTCEYRYALKADGLCHLDAETTEECCASRSVDGSCLKCRNGLYLIQGKCQ